MLMTNVIIVTVNSSVKRCVCLVPYMATNNRYSYTMWPLKTG